MSLEDKELDEMFHGEPKPLHPDTIYISSEKPAEKPVARKRTETKEEKPVDAQWEPVKPAPDWFSKLKKAVVWAVGFGSLSCLVFYWQNAGLMAESIAVPTIAVCTALAGWGVGKNAR